MQLGAEMPVLEDPDHGAEGGGDREQVHDNGFQGQNDGAGEQEEQQVGHDDDEGDGSRCVLHDELDGVDVVGGCPGHQELTAGGRRQGADAAQQVAGVVAGDRAAAQHREHGNVGAGALAERLLHGRR